MSLYYFINMAQVIRKYQSGGPIKINDRYYLPDSFSKEMKQLAETYAKNIGYTGDFLTAYRGQIDAVIKSLTEGTGRFNADGTFTSSNPDFVGNTGSEYSKEFNINKGTGTAEDASRSALKVIYDNLPEISEYAVPKRYDVTLQSLINELYGDDFKDLDKPNETTGIRSTENRIAAATRAIDHEINRLQSDSDYRNKFSYSDNDYNNWNNRTSSIIADYQKIKNAIQDGNVTSEEIANLPAGFNIGDLFSTSSDLYEQIQEENKQKQAQAKQEQEAKKTAHKAYLNTLQPSFNLFGIELPNESGTYISLNDWINQNTSEDDETYLNTLANLINSQFRVGDNSYNIDYTDYFGLDQLQNYRLVKQWEGNPLNINEGQFYIVDTYDSLKYPVQVIKDTNQLYSIIDDNNNIFSGLQLRTPNNPLSKLNFKRTNTDRTFSVEEYNKEANIVKIKILSTGEIRDVKLPKDINIDNVYDLTLQGINNIIRKHQSGGKIEKFQNSGIFSTPEFKIEPQTTIKLPEFTKPVYNKQLVELAKYYLNHLNSTDSPNRELFYTHPVEHVPSGYIKPYTDKQTRQWATDRLNQLKQEVTGTQGEDITGTEFKFTPKMSDVYDISSLVSNIGYNIAQTNELLDNFKVAKLQVPTEVPSKVVGDYNTLNASRQQAGNINTQARNIAESTSDLGTAINTQLAGNTQAGAIKLQGDNAYNTAVRQSEAVNQTRLENNAKIAAEIANQNHQNAISLNNYKTQLKSQLLGITGQNIDRFITQKRTDARENELKLKEVQKNLALNSLQKKYENQFNTWESNTYLNKAKQYLIGQGIDISGLSDRNILDKYYESNTKDYEAVNKYYSDLIETFSNEYISSLLNNDNPWRPYTINNLGQREYKKKGGKIRQENSKNIRQSMIEFAKIYRTLSKGTLALIKEALK